MVQQGCILGALLLRSLGTLVVRVQPGQVVLAAIGGGRAAEVAPAARVAHRVVSVRPGARRATRGRGREVGLFKGDASIHCGGEGTRRTVRRVLVVLLVVVWIVVWIVRVLQRQRSSQDVGTGRVRVRKDGRGKITGERCRCSDR